MHFRDSGASGNTICATLCGANPSNGPCVSSSRIEATMFVLLYRIADRIRQRGRARAWETTRALGRRGEDIAHRYLQREGMTVVARNYRTATGAGEIDLVAWHGDTLVFVEVKT